MSVWVCASVFVSWRLVHTVLIEFHYIWLGLLWVLILIVFFSLNVFVIWVYSLNLRLCCQVFFIVQSWKRVIVYHWFPISGHCWYSQIVFLPRRVYCLNVRVLFRLSIGSLKIYSWHYFLWEDVSKCYLLLWRVSVHIVGVVSGVSLQIFKIFKLVQLLLISIKIIIILSQSRVWVSSHLILISLLR
jgi:hypothetical protein